MTLLTCALLLAVADVLIALAVARFCGMNHLEDDE